MRRRRRLAIAGLTAAAVAAAMVAVVFNGPTALADVAGPTFASTSNSSDPHVISCVDGSTPGYCLYTSQDMGQQYAQPYGCLQNPGYCDNYYPMVLTRGYFSTNGYDGWVFKGQMWNESFMDTAHGGFVPPAALHMWAPSAVKGPVGNDYYLYIPDVSDASSWGVHHTSRIAVIRSTTGPFGPFSYLGTVTYSSGYMSDPDIVLDGSDRHLIWADGDFDTCGGLKYAKLNTDMLTTTSGTTQTLTVNGAIALGNCDPDGAGPLPAVGHPYMEGASLYKWQTWSSGGGSGQPWTILFAAKPTGVPNECTDANAGFGVSNTDNEVIAYATSAFPNGPYTYRGIVMCGSTTEWTNQATVLTTTNGKKVIIYHDGPAAPDRARKLHAECLFMGNSGGGLIAGVYRQPLDATYGFNNCTTGSNAAYVGLKGKDPQQSSWPPMISVTNGNSDLVASRFQVGPWERFKFELIDSATQTYAIRALSNGNYVCSPNASTPVAPTCTSSSGNSARFVKEAPIGPGDLFFLKSKANNLYLSINSSGKVVPDASGTGGAIGFNSFKYGGS